jgi:hypothetical protein
MVILEGGEGGRWCSWRGGRGVDDGPGDDMWQIGGPGNDERWMAAALWNKYTDILPKL